jgi:hypothetical protein
MRTRNFLAAAALALGAVAAPAALTTSPASAACATGAWSPTASGKPVSLSAGSAQGIYLWHDGSGWHLRATHPGTARTVFTGVIDSSGGISGVKRSLESNDVAYEATGSRIKFSFKNRSHIDGIDFVVGCSNRFTVSASVNGAPIANTGVFLGSGSVNPTSVPFALERS